MKPLVWIKSIEEQATNEGFELGDSSVVSISPDEAVRFSYDQLVRDLNSSECRFPADAAFIQEVSESFKIYLYCGLHLEEYEEFISDEERAQFIDIKNRHMWYTLDQLHRGGYVDETLLQMFKIQLDYQPEPGSSAWYVYQARQFISYSKAICEAWPQMHVANKAMIIGDIRRYLVSISRRHLQPQGYAELYDTLSVFDNKVGYMEFLRGVSLESIMLSYGFKFKKQELIVLRRIALFCADGTMDLYIKEKQMQSLLGEK